MRGWDNRGKERTKKGLITCKQADGSVPLPGWPLHLITAGYFVLLNSSRSLRRTARRLWAGEQEEIWGTDMRETKGLGTRVWKALWRTLLSSSPEKPERAVCAACECIIRCLWCACVVVPHSGGIAMLNVAWVLPGNSHSHSLPTAQVRKWEQGTAAEGHQHGDRNPLGPPGPPHSATHHSNFSGHPVSGLHYPSQGTISSLLLHPILLSQILVSYHSCYVLIWCTPESVTFLWISIQFAKIYCFFPSLFLRSGRLTLDHNTKILSQLYLLLWFLKLCLHFLISHL